MHPDVELLRSIKTFTQLVKYLRDKLDWPIESDNFDDLTFDYEPEELGIDAKTAVKIKEIKQLRPLTSRQPWGVFFISFEPKQLPIVVLRRILRSLVIKKRASANKSQQAAWKLHDLLFISSYGESDHREITFAHFSEPADRLFGDLPTLRVLGWDDDDTKLKMDHVVHKLAENMRWPDDEDDAGTWRKKWTDAFELRPREVITTSKELAIRLADLAKSIRQRANLILSIESERGDLRKMHKAFQTALIHDLNQDDFADMYAQTIAYGLLAARVSRPAGIVADNLADMVPITNPFLKEMLGTFLSIGGRKGKIDFDELGIQEVVDLLNNPDTHMEAILRDFGKRTMQEDPVIHFYELFLKEYDKKKKVERGVFYTPQPVVSYIVRSVHELLKKEFGLEDGLASTITWGEMAKQNPHITIPEGVSPDEHFVQMLDPATGTATFLVEIIEVIYQTMISKWRKEKYTEFELGDLWNEYVPKHLLPRLYGFELMMAPYAIAHMKIGLKLAETGYKFRSDERAHIYLTNSLEPPSDMAEQPEFEEWSPALAHEAKAVNAVKRKKRFTVVVGNPPYSGHSANIDEWITDMVEEYYLVDGKPMQEANVKWLLDDYVKFIRLGQFIIRQCGSGVFSFITNHGYIDNPTFRGMRFQFIENFDMLHFLDLHGNTKKKERTDDGTLDGNVFDIQQGVAIFTAVRHADKTQGYIRHCHLRGTRENKYLTLGENTLAEMSWNTVHPAAPYWLFVPQDVGLREEYDMAVNLVEASPEFSLGILTKRDDLLVDFSRKTILMKLELFTDLKVADSAVAEHYGLPHADKDKWNLKAARKAARPVDKIYVRKLMYRPFDIRYVYYHDALVARMNTRVLSHLDAVADNIGLILGRQGMATGSSQWDVCYVCNSLVDQNIFRRGGGTVFPLHLKVQEQGLNFGASLNLSPRVQEYITKFRKTPEDIFHYAYSVFHSPTYRTRYAEFLKIDFPRLPLTSSLELFKELAKLGGELVALHLMESPKLDKHITQFIGKGSHEVEKISYSDETVWIDKAQTQGFHGVSENVWNFHIGGYQVCQKWLKDRKGRTLSSDDINHYHCIVVALNETVRIMAVIDKVIEQHGGWPGAFVEKPEEKKEYNPPSEPLQKVAEKATKPYTPKSLTVISKQVPFSRDDSKTWLAISNWVKETMSINTFWINFALDISSKLKNSSKLSEKEKADMKQCWEQAVKKGFKIR